MFFFVWYHLGKSNFQSTAISFYTLNEYTLEPYTAPRHRYIFAFIEGRRQVLIVSAWLAWRRWRGRNKLELF